MAFSFRNIRLDGCRLGAPSPKDYRAVFKDRPLPDRVDLRPNCTPVENQGQLGSCTANASVGALEYLYKTRDGRSDDLSRLFVYFNARRMSARTAEDTGCFIREAMAAILAYGACRESTWPYDIGSFAQEPLSQAYLEARQYGAVQYSRVDGSRGALSALADGYPVVFGIALPRRCYEEAAQNGIMPSPTEEERRTPQTSGHAMLMVGYDRNDKRFIVRNSWGADWGDQGYCRIPFDVINDFCSPGELWIVLKPELQPNFSIVRTGAAAETRTEPAEDEPASGTIASKLRDEIRSSLMKDLSASSHKIDRILQGTHETKAKVPASDATEFPLPLSPAGWPDTAGRFRADVNPPDADNKTFFVGTWRGTFTTKGVECKAEMVFQPGGEFSGLTESLNGWYAFHTVGTWKLLGKGNVQMKYTDYSPRVWNKTKIYCPDNENIHFKVINKNLIESNLCKWDRVVE